MRRQCGVGATEYIILLALAALATFALYEKYGRTAGGKVGGAGKRVEALGTEQGGYVHEPSAQSGATSGSRVEGAGSSAASPVDALPEPIGAAGSGGQSTIDTRAVILLGIAVLAIGALMILAMFQRVRKVKKKASLKR